MVIEAILPALLGGMLIGLSATLLLLCNGQCAGITGIIGGLLHTGNNEWLWRAAFVVGLFLSGLILAPHLPQAFDWSVERSAPALLLAGLLVGFGTRLSGGCTSGHGICGISRLSVPAVVATMAFMAVAMVVVFVVNHALGGVV